MLIKTSDITSIKPFLANLYIPPAESHKGQNGKVLVIGGSTLFHAASLWAAEIVTHFVDMVHYCSTQENEEIFINLKTIFRNGIVIPKDQLPDYVKEDEVILVGPGMVRGELESYELRVTSFKQILEIQDEAEYTYFLTKYLIENFPEKKFVFDAGALQMMDPEWLLQLKEKPILTPHQLEFERLFNIPIQEKTLEEKIEIVKETAKKYSCIIMLKAISDIVSDGEKVYVIEGGNAGLTKGGSGDILAGLTAALASKNDSLSSTIIASYVLKKTAEDLFLTKETWYNMNDVIQKIPEILKKLLYN
jgi:hydroxyethylthiazole kinase-like uncharacterized protein yjeF